MLSLKDKTRLHSFKIKTSNNVFVWSSSWMLVRLLAVNIGFNLADIHWINDALRYSAQTV